nr:hypothetical protein [Tanacetum cinerariifolium]
EGVSDEELLVNMLGLMNDGVDDLHKLKPLSRQRVSGSRSVSDVWGVLQAMCCGLTPK